MESANKSETQLFHNNQDDNPEYRIKIGSVLIRQARQTDRDLIESLKQTATYRHRHVDWFDLSDWLDKPPFMISEHNNGNQGVLAIFADQTEAAWVRLAAINRVMGSKHQIFIQLAEMFNQATPFLEKLGITEMNWMSHLRWPDRWVEQLGFDHASKMVTFGKNDFWTPAFSPAPQLFIRSALPEDMPKLAKLESETYAPLWQHSARTLHFAWRDALCFDIAMINGQIVGFQHSTKHKKSAHLARITVSPEFQGQGIGSALLSRAIKQYERAGMTSVTLNTQVENLGAQRLYRRFGFTPTGYEVPLWTQKL